MTAPETIERERVDTPATQRRLYRSNNEKVLAGVCGGLGEYFSVDPVWFRIGFVVLALGGGSGVLIYLVLWLIVQPRPDGYSPPPTAKGQVTGTAVIGIVLVFVGTIALVNTVAPWLGQYFWPITFVVGGLALVMGGLNHDNP
ncbi:MAG TPA: PspC domain-containing protein [Acidimicrobiia bacterium]|nr:PspC domain-containing protein [Acidimicrobiia bacterium]